MNLGNYKSLPFNESYITIIKTTFKLNNAFDIKWKLFYYDESNFDYQFSEHEDEIYSEIILSQVLLVDSLIPNMKDKKFDFSNTEFIDTSYNPDTVNHLILSRDLLFDWAHYYHSLSNNRPKFDFSFNIKWSDDDDMKKENFDQIALHYAKYIEDTINRD